MRRRLVRFLVLVGVLAVVAACVRPLPPVPFRLPTIYEGRIEEGRLSSEIVPEACPEVRAVLRPLTGAWIAVIDQPSGEMVGSADATFEVSWCRPAGDIGDFELEGSMTFTCCLSEAGDPSQFSGPATVRRVDRAITVDLDIQQGTGHYRDARGLCRVETGMSSPEPPPPGSAPTYGGTVTCRIGDADDPPPPPSFHLVTERVHDAVLGQPYRAPLAAVGGTPPYTWSAAGLPSGLRVEGDAIVGSSTTPGLVTFEATVHDAVGLARTVTMTVVTQDPEIFGTIQPVSTDPHRLWAGYEESVSDDGGMVVFVSDSVGLTDPPAERFTDDVFAWDRTANTMRRITDDIWRNYWDVEVSGDGSTVVFQVIDALVPEDTDGEMDVYLADTAGGPLTLASPGGGSELSSSAVSDDGQVVVFVRRDDDGRNTVQHWDRATGAVGVIVTTQAEVGNLHLSDDASRLMFVSAATDLVPGDTNGLSDVFVVDLPTGEITKLDTGDGVLSGASLSGDGGTVAFASDTDAFLPAGEVDRNGGGDIFRYDLATSQVVRATNGEWPSTGPNLSSDPPVSDDGGTIVFTSYATDIARGELDLDGIDDFFVWNAGTGVVSRLTRLRVAPPPPTPPSSRVMIGAQLSGDGRTVVFSSDWPIAVDPTDPVSERDSWSHSYIWTRTN